MYHVTCENVKSKMKGLKMYMILKSRRGNASSPAPNLSKRCATPTKRYWDVHEEIDTEVDVLSLQPQPVIPYDAVKARNLMTQCEKHALVIKPVDAQENWEDHIVRYENIIKFYLTL